MEDAQLIRTLNVFAARIVFLECQALAMQRLLELANIASEGRYDALLAKICQEAKDVLGPQEDDAGKLAEFLKKYEGTPQ
jgi:hypothetical protein